MTVRFDTTKVIGNDRAIRAKRKVTWMGVTMQAIQFELLTGTKVKLASSDFLLVVIIPSGSHFELFTQFL